MAHSPTTVHVGDSSVDVAAVGNWLANHVALFVLVAAILFVFFLFQKGGFAEKYLQYRIRRQELDAKQLDDARVIADIIARRYEREDPLLPFDKPVKGPKP